VIKNILKLNIARFNMYNIHAMYKRCPTLGHSLQFKHRNNSKILKQIPQNILLHDLNVSYVRDEIKKLSQRYVDRLEEHSNILAIDLMNDVETPRRLKRKLSQDLCIKLYYKV